MKDARLDEQLVPPKEIKQDQVRKEQVPKTTAGMTKIMTTF